MTRLGIKRLLIQLSGAGVVIGILLIAIIGKFCRFWKILKKKKNINGTEVYKGHCLLVKVGFGVRMRVWPGVRVVMELGLGSGSRLGVELGLGLRLKK